jgi:hypothetical protein
MPIAYPILREGNTPNLTHQIVRHARDAALQTGRAEVNAAPVAPRQGYQPLNWPFASRHSSAMATQTSGSLNNARS